jgi:transglutaminase-like putative cysteine protease
MTTRLTVSHTTSYRYDAPVTSSYNEARLEPRSDHSQTVLSWSLDVRPQARVGRHVDYWGSIVHHFDLQVPHEQLTVVGHAVVETGLSTPGPGKLTWNDLADETLRDQFHEVLGATDKVVLDDDIRAVAADLRAAAATPAEAVEAAVAWVHEHVMYDPGATGVETTSAEVFVGRRGVCQDHAHLALAVLRAMGVPAWYVSGCLHPHPEPQIGERVRGESHAWVAAWTGRVWPLDPTNLSVVSDRHVRVATGRDYDDVIPFRGVYDGGGNDQELAVTVEVTRTA